MEKVLYLKSISKNHFWIDLIVNWEKKYNWIPEVLAGDNENYQDYIKREFINIELYNHSEAIRGANPDFLSSAYVFSEKELTFISKYENDFISMIDRWSINSSKVDYFILRNYFINMVGIWLEILIQKNISLVILPSIPHRLYDYACYVACKVLKIPYLMIERTGEIRKKDNSYVLTAFVVDNISNRTKTIYDQYLKEKVNINESDFELIDYMNNNYSNSMPNYFLEKELISKQKKTLSSIINKVFLTLKKTIMFLVVGFKKSQSIFKFTLRNKINDVPRVALRLEVFIIGLLNKIRVQKAINYYNKNISKPSYKDNYVYIAPHFRPERSTIPDAGYFHDIELIIDLISSNIPSDWKIFYKEHKSNFRKPIQWNNILTSRSYMRINNKYPNLCFIDKDEDPFKLIDNSVFVVTATGTTGWESILRGKPAVIFGDAWYRHFPGVFYARNNKDIEDAVNKINNGFEISSLKIASYAKYILANSSEVFEFVRYEDTEKLKRENNSEYRTLINEYCKHFVQKFDSLS